MIHGRVIGELWATVKLKSLNGLKLLIVRPEGVGPTEDLVAVDLMGAGRGDSVIVAQGRAARNAIGDPDGAIEAAVVAIVDDQACDLPKAVPVFEPEPKAPVDLLADAEDEAEAAPKKPARKKSSGKSSASSSAAPIESEPEPEPEPESEPEVAPETAKKTRAKPKPKPKPGAGSRAKKAEDDAAEAKVAEEVTADLFVVDEEADLLPAQEPEEVFELIVEEDETNDVPGFEDVDAIWGDEDDDETRS